MGCSYKNTKTLLGLSKETLWWQMSKCDIEVFYNLPPEFLLFFVAAITLIPTVLDIYSSVFLFVLTVKKNCFLYIQLKETRNENPGGSSNNHKIYKHKNKQVLKIQFEILCPSKSSSKLDCASHFLLPLS